MVRLDVFEAKMVAGRTEPVELAPELVLEGQILGDRFDHDVAVFQVGHLGGKGEPAEGGVPVGRQQLPLLHQFAHRFLNPGSTFIQERSRDIARHGA